MIITIQKRYAHKDALYASCIMRYMNMCMIICLALIMLLIPWADRSLAEEGHKKQARIVYTSDTWGFLEPCST